MRISAFRQWRTAVRRLSVLFTIVALPITARAADVVGVVVDPAGQPVPRALVRSLDQSGRPLATTFSDDTGQFRVEAASEACRVEVSLTGFQATTTPCAAAGATRVVLAIAPIRESVVDSVTRTEAPEAQVGASVSTFTAEDLDRRDRPFVADLLQSAPGAQVIRTGAPGAQTSLFVRGGESTYNKVLLDGIPINEPGGVFNFSNLSTEGIDRIEFVRGAQSALFGSDAMASVVQLFTARGGAGQRAAVQMDGGTYGTFHGSANAAGRSGIFDYALDVARLSTDNRVPNSAFRNTTWTANVGAALTDAAMLRIVARGEVERTGTPGQTAFERPDLDAHFDRNDAVFGISFDDRLRPWLRQRASYSLSRSDQTSADLVADPPYTPMFGASQAPFPFSDFTFDNQTLLHRHHASYQADLTLANDATRGQQILTLLADWDGERIEQQDVLAASTSRASRDNFGASAEQQMIWPRVSATVGGRVEHNESFGTAAVPRGSIVFVARASAGQIGDTRLKGSAGLGIKEPTVVQSFSTSPFFLGNPNLEPERSRTADVGIEQRLARDRARVTFTWFDNRYSNIISTTNPDPVTFDSHYDNIGDTRARGLELSGDAVPIAAIQVHAGYTFLDSEVVTSTSAFSPVFAVGQWAFRRPRHSGFLDVSWTRDRVTADLNGTFVGRFVDSDFASLTPPLVENPGYSVWNARLSVQIVRQAAFILSADNLANRDYMEPLGYQTLGRAARAGVRFTF